MWSLHGRNFFPRRCSLSAAVYFGVIKSLYYRGKKGEIYSVRKGLKGNEFGVLWWSRHIDLWDLFEFPSPQLKKLGEAPKNRRDASMFGYWAFHLVTFLVKITRSKFVLTSPVPTLHRSIRTWKYRKEYKLNVWVRMIKSYHEATVLDWSSTVLVWSYFGRQPHSRFHNVFTAWSSFFCLASVVLTTGSSTEHKQHFLSRLPIQMFSFVEFTMYKFPLFLYLKTLAEKRTLNTSQHSAQPRRFIRVRLKTESYR